MSNSKTDDPTMTESTDLTTQQPQPGETSTAMPSASPTARAIRVGAALTAAAAAAGVGALAAPAPTPSSSLAWTMSAQAAPVALEPTTMSAADRAAEARRSARSSRSADRTDPREAADAEKALRREAAAELAEQEAKEKAEKEAAAKAPKPVGTRYATVGLNVRKSPDTDAKIVTVLDRGDKVRITDETDDGWRQVVVDGKARWVKGSYLSKKKPAAQKTTSTPRGLSSAPCASGSGVESGLRANTIAVHRAVCAVFPSVSSYGGLRGGGGNHGSGRALDIMVSGGTGDQVAAFVRANASALGVSEVIWSQRIWTVQRSGEGWRWMSDRGSATANHYDHVHVSTY